MGFLDALGWGIIGWIVAAPRPSKTENNTTIINDYSEVAEAINWLSNSTKSIADSNRNITIPVSEWDKIQYDLDSYHNRFKESKRQLKIALDNIFYMEYHFWLNVNTSLIEQIIEYFLHFDSYDLRYDKDKRDIGVDVDIEYPLYLLLYERNKPDDCQKYLDKESATYMRIAFQTFDPIRCGLRKSCSLDSFLPKVWPHMGV